MCARHWPRLRNCGWPAGSTVIRFLVRLPSPFPRPGLIPPERCAGPRSRRADGHRSRREAALTVAPRSVSLEQDGRQGGVLSSCDGILQPKSLDEPDSRSVLRTQARHPIGVEWPVDVERDLVCPGIAQRTRMPYQDAPLSDDMRQRYPVRQRTVLGSRLRRGVRDPSLPVPRVVSASSPISITPQPP
jgi:hypothetical protein